VPDTDLQLRPLDAADPDQMAAWHATYHAAHSLGLEHATPRLLPETARTSSSTARVSGPSAGPGTSTVRSSSPGR
jgi:hypothetical protein